MTNQKKFMSIDDIEYLIKRLEMIKSHIESGNGHMAIAKIIADIAILKTFR